MYTITIIILLIISIVYLIYDRKYINWYILSLFVIICSCYSYIEFYFCNNFDMVPAWIFGKNAIIGISIFTIPIEDILNREPNSLISSSIKLLVGRYDFSATFRMIERFAKSSK